MAKEFNYDYSDIIVFLLVASIGVLIGSHLLYVLVNYKNIIYIVENIKKIDTLKELFSALNYIAGGSVFYGGLIGGIIAGYIVSKKNSKYTVFFDISAVSIPLFHAFGRIGCFLGGCCYGIESTIGFRYTRNPIVEANGVIRFPVQIVESLFNIAIFIFLHYLLRGTKLKNKLLYVYLCMYPVGRFFLEFLRGDTYRGIWFSLSTSQIISILIISGLIIRFLYKSQQTRLKHQT
jgi:phosphatidylglycerol:prolipoprotein diacylglycerol transferase